MDGEIFETGGNARSDTWALVSLLTGRFGPLALSRAAGEAAAAERTGDIEQSAIWRSVIDQLRHALCRPEATSAV